MSTLDKLEGDAATFRMLVREAGLADKFADPELHVTLFLPVESELAAFVQDNEWLLSDAGRPILRDVVRYHVIDRPMNAESLVRGNYVSNLDGSRVRVTEPQIVLQDELRNEVKIVLPDIHEGPSFVHGIDRPLMPARNVTHLLRRMGYKQFEEAARRSGLLDAVRRGEPMSVFAMTDVAMRDAGIEASLPKEKLWNLLSNHIMTERAFVKDLSNVVVSQTTLTIPTRKGEATLLAWDVAALDGVIFEVDAPLAQ